jgi:hypothetical protein
LGLFFPERVEQVDEGIHLATLTSDL